MNEPQGIIRQFGGASDASEIEMAPSGQFVDSTSHMRCFITAITQRGWSVDLKVKLAYVWRNDGRGYPKELFIVFRPKNTMIPLKAAKQLPTRKLDKKYLIGNQSGDYDPKLFFNTGYFVSFPYGNGIHLKDRKIVEMTLRISIPLDCPNELLGKIVHADLDYLTSPTFVLCQNARVNFVVVA